MAVRQQIPVEIGRGQFSGGDAARVPDGFVRKLRNIVYTDGETVSRPPLTYDNLTNIRALEIYHDRAAGASRLVAVKSVAPIASTNSVFFRKGASGETWDAGVTGDAYSRYEYVHDSATYNDLLMVAGYTAAYEKTSVVAYDGATVDTSPLQERFAYSLGPKALAVYKQRLFLAAPTVYFQAEAGDVYDFSGWTATSCTLSTVAEGSTTTRVLTPTATTGAMFRGGGFSLDSTDTLRTVRWLVSAAPTSPTYALPLTFQLRYRRARFNNTVYPAGAIVTPSTPNGFMYRCIVAGTSAAGAPVYPTTIGGQVVDGGVTWLCEATDVLTEARVNVSTLSQGSGPTFWDLKARIPEQNAAAGFDCVILFGHGGAAITLASAKISFLDGRADDDPRKANYGQQLTRGTFQYPFVNNDDWIGVGSPIGEVDHDDYIYFTDVSGMTVSAESNYRVTEVPGAVTGLRSVAGKLVVFKHKARWVFSASEDSNIVVLPEGDAYVCDGNRNAKSHDVSDEGVLYWAGENGVYESKDPHDIPREICGAAMRAEMFSKSASTWVESQAAPANRVLLTVDQRNKRVLVYVQKGVIHCYDIRQEAWSVIDAGGDSTISARGYQICDMTYNPGTGHTYIAFSEAATGTAGLARLDATQSPAEDQISSSGTLDVHHDLILKPVEGRPRVDLALDQVFMHVDSSTSGQMASASVSFDQGATFEETDAPREIDTTDANYEPMRFSIWQSWGTMTPRILVSGKAGASALKISGLELDVRAAKKPEYPKR